MIWALAIGLVLAVGVFLVAPFLGGAATLDTKGEIAAYRTALDSAETEADRAALARRLLDADALSTTAPERSGASISILLTFALLGGTLGLYSWLGSPNFTPEVRQPPPAPVEADPELVALLPRFEARLADAPEDALGWQLYGRTLVAVGRGKEGLAAYARAMTLSETPELRQEYEAAQAFVSGAMRGPSAEDIAAMQELSAADQQRAIEGMVVGLRTRLEAEPNDPAGWEQLLRSRRVLEQAEELEADIAVLRTVLPEQADAIIAASEE